MPQDVAVPGIDVLENDPRVVKVLSEVLDALELHNFKKMYRIPGIKTDWPYNTDLIINSALIFKNCLPVYTRKTGLSLRGISLERLEIFTAAASIETHKLSKEFQELSPKMIRHCVYQFNKSASFGDMALYVLALHESGLQFPAMARITKEKCREFVKGLNHAISKHPEPKKFDSSNPSEEFYNRVVNSKPPYGEFNFSLESQITSLFILRALYGEQRLMEVFDKHPTGIHNPRKLFKLFREWDTVKDYPLDWILEVM